VDDEIIGHHNSFDPRYNSAGRLNVKNIGAQMVGFRNGWGKTVW
jgi:hypothetical protein